MRRHFRQHSENGVLDEIPGVLFLWPPCPQFLILARQAPSFLAANNHSQAKSKQSTDSMIGNACRNGTPPIPVSFSAGNTKLKRINIRAQHFGSAIVVQNETLFRATVDEGSVRSSAVRWARPPVDQNPPDTQYDRCLRARNGQSIRLRLAYCSAHGTANHECRGRFEMATLTYEPISTAARQAVAICTLGTDSDQVRIISSRLRGSGFSVVETTDPEEALERIRTDACRVFIVELAQPAIDGLAFLDQALRLDPGAYVILFSRDYQVDSAIEAIKRGAYDFVGSPIDFVRLDRTLQEIADVFSQRSHIRFLEETLLENSQFHGIVGKSPAMLEVLDLAKKVARHYSNVLISGPTGAGKELVARALHELSPVAKARFAVCNCSALVDTILESQLFGHVRGSFTGASDSRVGLFEYANNGTVFLDEIGETSPSMQAKLLRVVQNREIQRVGSPETKKVNIRLIAATNRDLRSEVNAGQFRQDLFYRLSSIEIRVPGLAERSDDIPILVRHFLNKYNHAYGRSLRGLTRRAQIALVQHNWPGNIRELENVIATAAITATADFVDLDDLPEHLRKPGRASGIEEEGAPLSLREARRLHIQKVLRMCHGNRVRAAAVLGIGRTSLYRFLKRNGPRAAINRAFV